METNLKGKTVLITGGATGIGRATALAFAKEGSRLALVDIAKPDFVGRDAVRRDRASGSARRLVTFVVDATDADAIGDEPVV